MNNIDLIKILNNIVRVLERILEFISYKVSGLKLVLLKFNQVRLTLVKLNKI